MYYSTIACLDSDHPQNMVWVKMVYIGDHIIQHSCSPTRKPTHNPSHNYASDHRRSSAAVIQKLLLLEECTCLWQVHGLSLSAVLLQSLVCPSASFWSGQRSFPGCKHIPGRRCVPSPQEEKISFILSWMSCSCGSLLDVSRGSASGIQLSY